VGVRGHKGRAFGPEFTITFSNNPGILRSLEIDTRNINNQGSPDYWIANQRQGEFHSRYSTNLGRINTLKYGSNLLYTSSDLTAQAPAGTIVKVGSQELRVTTAHNALLTLSEPFLGASIVGKLASTGVSVSAFNYGSLEATPLTNTDKLTISMPTETLAAEAALNIIKSTGSAGSAATANGKIYIGTASTGCAFLTDYHWDSKTADMTATTTKLYVLNNHQCFSDNIITSPNGYIYTRLEDYDSASLYKTSGDSATVTPTLMIKRGSTTAYAVAPVESTAGSQNFVKSYTTVATAYTLAAAAGTGGTLSAGNRIFVNGHGPATVTSAVSSTETAVVTSGGEPKDLFGNDFSGAKFPLTKAVTQTSIVAGNVLVLNGRRYRVKSTTTSATAGDTITLTETYAGGSLLQLCASCVTSVPVDGLHITTSKKIETSLGDKLLIGGYAHDDLAMTITASQAQSATRTFFAHKTSPGTNYGDSTLVKESAGAASALTGYSGNLFKIVNGGALGFTGSIITEASSPTTYQYVAQCANRGTCDHTTGLCNCFTGYAGDACDSQNVMAE
jgi:hypothetical protein